MARGQPIVRGNPIVVFGPLLAAMMTAWFWPAPARGAEPEGRRLDNDEFRRGLLDLKLIDLLDYHLASYPPAEELTRLLLQREIKLTIWGDESADRVRRRAALAGANDILSRIIREHGSDARAIQWQLALAQSLIYEQAEPYYSNILYRGGTEADRAELGALTERAAAGLRRLLEFLETEYARIDELSVSEYEKLDDSGYIIELEEAMPKAEYMLRWAKFYTALAMNKARLRRRALFAEVFNELTQQTALLTTAHSVSHVQAQSLLLAGMTCRQLADQVSAVRLLRDAVRVADALPDPQQRRDLQWLVTLASVEHVRALRDSGRLDDAARALRALRQRISLSNRDDFGHQLVLALLEGSIEQARSRPAARGGDPAPAEALSDRAAKPLMELVKQQPARRDEVYATLYSHLRTAADPRTLHPFQQCALIAGHIAEATRLRHGPTGEAPEGDDRRRDEARAIALLDEAIDLARELIGRGKRLSGGLFCEALYNLAVAEHHRGLRADAARRFAAVAEQCPRFSRALPAATYAVEIAAQLAEDPTLRARREVRDLLVQTLRTLVHGFAGSEAAEYWRFFLAQALEDNEDAAAAADEYARVAEQHAHFLTAQFRAARCQIVSLTERATARSAEPQQIKRLAASARRAVEHFKALAGQTPDGAGVGRLLAESDVLLAEMNVLPGVDRPRQAIALLEGFEERHSRHRDLMGRALRARIIAFEATGQIEQAREAVPRYIASTPTEAGATLQALFNTTWAEIEHYRKLRRQDLAVQKAESALMFAQQIFLWAQSRPEAASEDDLHFLRLQLAEANLTTHHLPEALGFFRQAAATDAGRHADGLAHDPRVLMGLARTLSALDRHAEALPLFNRLHQESPPGSARRFAALLGDLRCRTALGEDPAGIVDVIRQNRYLNPDMGGEELKRQFAELQRRNEERNNRP